MEIKEFEVIFFDAAGTLFQLRESVGAGYARVAAACGFTLDPAATGAAFRERWAGCPPPNPGAPSDDDDRSWWRGLVDGILDSLGEIPGLGDTERESLFEALYTHYAHHSAWQLYSETMEVLEFLQENTSCKLGVLSNFDRRLHTILEGFNLSGLFDRIVVSSEIGFSKPRPEIFAAAWRGLASSPARCLHIGDDPVHDWQGARDAGMEVLELRRPGNDLRIILDRLEG